ncbi:NAD(P)H-hydrate dehydratase [Altericroceibacterium xinjiangense]|uniref:NAD(P)H-hydrate dehydratase n=1 Tax=Altericroceibacterium xinjiangense TaxID=762261 RepID=UPI000F7EB8E8|nr:NAD(P)H-hydrate dehydratase [Altericroceibacterium xinjiangense]
MTGPGDPILTAVQMRAAEQALIDRGASIESLMQRAGEGAADWIWRLSAGRSVTVLCGPGNNGGDGYVIAETLRRRGSKIAVVAPTGPATEAARAAKAAYRGAVVDRAKGDLLVDCLFGSGLSRPLDDKLVGLLCDLAVAHPHRVAIDLPSGIDADSGKPLNPGLPDYTLTLALGAWKFAHWTMPAMARMGERRLVPIGIEAVPEAAGLVEKPSLSVPARDAHKYTRGLVTVVGGPVSGASLLACEGAMRAGAGAVRLAAPLLHPAASPDIVLKDGPLAKALDDERTGAVLAGPGLGRADEAQARLRAVLAAGHPTVIDADALHLIDPERLSGFASPLILTPHEGELRQLAAAFALESESKLDRARELARKANAVVIAKGPDTVIAAPDGRTVLAPSPTSWLSVAGSGDVLAGVVASRLAACGDPFRAACEGNWLHGEAARVCGPVFTASTLARRVAAAYAACL